jgi:hypothetical protein
MDIILLLFKQYEMYESKSSRKNYEGSLENQEVREQPGDFLEIGRWVMGAGVE